MSIPSRVRAGDSLAEFPGNSWNALVDSYWANRDRAPRNQGTGASHGPRGSVPIIVQNKTGADVEFGGILAIDGIATDFSKNKNIRHHTPLAKGIKYADGKQWGITQGKIANDNIANLVISGTAWCKIDVQAESDDTAAPVVDDTAKLKSGSGVPIIWKESGTGVKWGVVLLGGGAIGLGAKLAKVSTEITAADDTIPGKLEIGAGKVIISEATENAGKFTYSDPQNAVAVDCYTMAPEITTVGTWVVVEKVDGRWMLVVELCP